MMDKLKLIKEKAHKEIVSVSDLIALENIEIKYIGRKAGELTELLKELKNLSDEEKRTIGPLANEIKGQIEEEISNKREQLIKAEWSSKLTAEFCDLTAPALPKKDKGHFHPLTAVQNELVELFSSMGFAVADGPELESDYFNFTAINIPEDHPARDMQDTFYIKNHPHFLLRTHTSSMQVRMMRELSAPLKVVVPGRCFRNESTDARHEHTFYQFEGFAVDKNINMSHMKGVLELVAKKLFGDDVMVRLRPKFYPFVEPGVNGEVSCFLCKGVGCGVCKHTGWMEVFGAGMIHPNVLKEGGIDTKEYQGFAFGFGLTRLVMLKYNIDDVRIMAGGDLRFIKQF